MAKRRSKSTEPTEQAPLTLAQIEVMADKAMRLSRMLAASKERRAAREERFGAGNTFNPKQQYQEKVVLAPDDTWAAALAAVKYLSASARIALPKGTRFEIRMDTKRGELSWVSQPAAMAKEPGWQEFMLAIGEKLIAHVDGYYLIGRQTA